MLLNVFSLDYPKSITRKQTGIEIYLYIVQITYFANLKAHIVYIQIYSLLEVEITKTLIAYM